MTERRNHGRDSRSSGAKRPGQRPQGASREHARDSARLATPEVPEASENTEAMDAVVVEPAPVDEPGGSGVGPSASSGTGSSGSGVGPSASSGTGSSGSGVGPSASSG